MAAIVCPTWAEVQRLAPEELEAVNIVKGEMNGDEFLWEQTYFDKIAQRNIKGCWKSSLDEKRSTRVEQTY